MSRKLLILESNWADDEDSYIIDSRSVTKVYSSIETLLSVDDYPFQITQRPLLSCRFQKDIEQFIKLDSNRTGVNVIILSAHGHFRQKNKVKNGKDKIVNSRKLAAIDGDINLSVEIKKVSHLLHRSIIILDSCAVGNNLDSFLKASGSLGVIGFSKNVDWIDSAVFILALLCKYQSEGVFSLQKKSHVKPKKILDQMQQSHYSLFFEELGIDYCFNE